MNRVLTIDFGFFGCMAPLCASLLSAPKNASEKWKKIDVVPLRLLTMAIPLIGHSIWGTFPFQYLSLLAIPLLLLYSGKRGKYNLKYFFYAFYPLHIVILYGIALLL